MKPFTCCAWSTTLPSPVAPQPAPPFVRGLKMSAQVCPCFFKNTFYQLCHHYTRFCLFLSPPARRKSEQQVPNLWPPPSTPVPPMLSEVTTEHCESQIWPCRPIPHYFKLFPTLPVTDQMSVAPKAFPETLHRFEIKCNLSPSNDLGQPHLMFHGRSYPEAPEETPKEFKNGLDW